jgi:hypothetical protein
MFSIIRTASKRWAREQRDDVRPAPSCAPPPGDPLLRLFPLAAESGRCGRSIPSELNPPIMKYRSVEVRSAAKIPCKRRVLRRVEAQFRNPFRETAHASGVSARGTVPAYDPARGPRSVQPEAATFRSKRSIGTPYRRVPTAAEQAVLA